MEWQDDHINFKEYARVITAENILDLGVVKKNPMGGQWRAGTQSQPSPTALSAEAKSMTRFVSHCRSR